MDTTQEYNENGNGVVLIKGQQVVEKEKFIIVCGGRGLGKHNQGGNFINVAKYHIQDIILNKFPNIPKFDKDTCQIVTPEELYENIGYKIHIDPQRPDAYATDDDDYFIDSLKRRIAQAEDDNLWYLLDPRNLDYFKQPLVQSNPVKKSDPTYMKKVNIGEIHRVSDFKKIFKLYKNIKYLAFFGHSWAGEYDGSLYIGDRSAEDTNLYYHDLEDLDISNVLSDAQLRIFSCRSAFKFKDYLCAAEIFAKILPGREIYGWQSSGGSVFTHDVNYGYTGINSNVKDPNKQIIDSNQKKTWLVANGQPTGWKKYVF